MTATSPRANAAFPGARELSTFPSLVVLVVVMLLPGFAWPQVPTPSQSHQGDNYTFRINSDLVVLHATVEDHKGAPVSGLDQNDFQVYEDGVRQRIKYFSHEDIPVTVGLVIDNSGSMGSKRGDVIAAALAFARSSNPRDQIFVVNFNEKVSFALPEDVPFTDQVSELEVALSKFSANGETALYDAIAAAFEHLEKGTRDKKVLIVISDGGDNASKHNLAQIKAMIGHPDVIIYTIGIFGEEDPDRNPGVLRQLAKDTGGEAFFPQSLKEVVPICERIAHDIRNQYTIAYVPTNRKLDGSYRVIEVKASAAGHGRLFVRTRARYHAPSEVPSPAQQTTKGLHEAILDVGLSTLGTSSIDRAFLRMRIQPGEL